MATENENIASVGNKFDTIVAVKFTYTEGGRWHSIDVSCTELMQIIHTGEVDGRKICALEVFTVTNDDDEKISFVYDFVAKAQGIHPWRLL